MPTECSTDCDLFGPAGGRRVAADFDGGAITSDAGGLLLGSTDCAIGVADRFVGCFRDGRVPDLIEHSVRTPIAQRVPPSRSATKTSHDELATTR